MNANLSGSKTGIPVENTGRNPSVTRWILGFFIIGFLWIVLSRSTQIEEFLKIMAEGRWEWVLAAALLQVLHYIVFTATYQSAFSTVEVKSRLLDLIPVTLGSLFVNVVAPTGGAAGAALFIDDAARRGQPPARTAAGLLSQLVSDFCAFLLILMVGLAYLFFQHALKAYQVAAAVGFLLITLILSGLLMLGQWRPDLLGRLLSWAQRTGNMLAGKLHRAPLLSEDWAERNAADFVQAAHAISKNPKGQARTVGLALAAHGLELACLYSLFLAFYGPIRFGPLIAGYAIGILFWIISITPQGIGLVEGVMALVYGSLGIPASTALTVSLAFRGLTFWLPLVLGFIALRRIKFFEMGQPPRTQEWGVSIISLLTALVGILNVLSAVTPPQADRLAARDTFLQLIVQRGGNLTAAISGFSLLILANGLSRRKHTAWLLALLVLTISSASFMIEGPGYEKIVLAAGLALWLLSMRDQFQARSDPPSIRQGLRALIAAVAFTLVYGVAGFYLLDRHYSVNFSLWDAIRQTVVMFTQFYDPGLQPITGFGRYFAASIYVVGAATLFFALLMLIRPVIIRHPAAQEERERAQCIVEAHGRSSLARMALFEDKSYFFSSGGSVIAFTEKGRVAVALGDPIGPAEDTGAAIGEFKKYCAKNDWQPSFYQVLPDNLEQYRAAGFNILCIGHEAIVDLGNFTLEGKPAKDLRYAYNRFIRLGYQATVYEPPLPDRLLPDLHSVSDEWLEKMHGSEKRFSLGWFEENYIRSSTVIVVHTPEGRISAFANINPEYQRNEASVDLMRYRKDAESGTMDYLFVSLFLWAKSKGFESFNLGLSSLSGVGETPGDPAVERAMHYVYEHINQFYNFKGLHAYKNKFYPTWSPRYVIYPGPGSLLPVALALSEADAAGNSVLSYVKPKLVRERELKSHLDGKSDVR